MYWSISPTCYAFNKTSEARGPPRSIGKSICLEPLLRVGGAREAVHPRTDNSLSGNVLQVVLDHHRPQGAAHGADLEGALVNVDLVAIQGAIVTLLLVHDQDGIGVDLLELLDSGPGWRGDAPLADRLEPAAIGGAKDGVPRILHRRPVALGDEQARGRAATGAHHGRAVVNALAEQRAINDV